MSDASNGLGKEPTQAAASTEPKDGWLTCVGCGYHLAPTMLVCSECGLPRFESEGPPGLARFAPSAIKSLWWAGWLLFAVGVMNAISAMGQILSMQMNSGFRTTSAPLWLDWIVPQLMMFGSHTDVVSVIVMVLLHRGRQSVHVTDWTAPLWRLTFWPMVACQCVVFLGVFVLFERALVARVSAGFAQGLVTWLGRNGAIVCVGIVNLVVMTRVAYLCGATTAAIQPIPRVLKWAWISCGMVLAGEVGYRVVGTWAAPAWWSTLGTLWVLSSLLLAGVQIFLGWTLAQTAALPMRADDQA